MTDAEVEAVARAKRPNYKTAERRWDSVGEMRLMAEAEGYVMVRRPGCMPFVMARDIWDKHSRAALDQAMAKER